MKLFYTLTVALLSFSAVYCSEDVQSVEVNADGNTEPVDYPTPQWDDDAVPVIAEEFNEEYGMPVSVLARLTGIGVEASDEALEWAEVNRGIDVTITNTEETPLYLYYVFGEGETEFIVRTILSRNN